MEYTSLIEFDLAGGTEHRYYGQSKLAGESKFYRGYVNSFGSIAREIPERPGLPIIGEHQITFKNVDLHFSQLMDLFTIRNQIARHLHGVLGSDPSTFETVYEGKLGPMKITPTTATVSIRDIGADRIKQALPGKISSAKYDNLPENLLSDFPNIIYGACSGGNGPVPCQYVDTASFIYVVAQHAVESVSAVYRYGVLVAAANYTVSTDSDGWTILTFTSDQEDASRPGEYAITADVRGYAPVCSWDTDGAMLIQNPVKGLRHFMTEYCGFSATDFDETAYSAALAASDDKGLILSAIISTRETMETTIGKFLESFNIDMFQSRAGKISFKIHSIDDYATTITLDDRADIMGEEEGKEEPSVAENESVVTRLQYNYAWNAVKQYFRYQPDAINTVLLAEIGEDIRDNVSLWYVRDSTTATTVAWEWLNFFGVKSHSITCTITTKTAIDKNLDLGTVLKLTHYAGPSATKEGLRDDICKILRMDFDPETLLCKLKLRRIAPGVGSALFVFGDETALAANWSAATDADKYYGYLADETTEQFADGSDPKRLY